MGSGNSIVSGELNVKLTIEYDGANYFGWQKQKNKPTIQNTIEESLQLLLGNRKIRLIGAGRTDTGVHALGQVANFRIGEYSMRKFGKAGLLRSLNAVLPADIAVKKLEFVGKDFHARYSAVSRTYRYYITLRRKGFSQGYYYFSKTKFDIDLAKEFCKLLIGTHSFKAFCKNKEDEHDFYCIVNKAGIKKRAGSVIEFEITANRFLHSMVRAIVGTMLKIASGKLELENFKRKFIKGEKLSIQYAPSNALVLYKINY